MDGLMDGWMDWKGPITSMRNTKNMAHKPSISEHRLLAPFFIIIDSIFNLKQVLSYYFITV